MTPAQLEMRTYLRWLDAHWHQVLGANLAMIGKIHARGWVVTK